MLTVNGGNIHYYVCGQDAAISAFQIVLSNNDNLESLSFEGFETAEGMTPEGYMYLVYSLEGKEFAAGTYALLRVNDSKVNYFLASDPCGNEVNGKEGSILGIGDNVTVTTYPNPFTKSVTVSYTGSANAEFVITNINGQVVYHQAATTNQFVWTPENVNSGVYFINVLVNGEKYRHQRLFIRNNF